MIHFRIHYYTLMQGQDTLLYTMIHFRIHYDTLLDTLSYTLGYTIIHFRIHYYTLRTHTHNTVNTHTHTHTHHIPHTRARAGARVRIHTHRAILGHPPNTYTLFYKKLIYKQLMATKGQNYY